MELLAPSRRLLTASLPALRGRPRKLLPSPRCPCNCFGSASAPRSASGLDGFDMRNGLQPRRLTMAMWDQAYLFRHLPGGSYADYDSVLDETVDRGYNTVRLDPMPQWIDLRNPDRIFEWSDPHRPFMPWGAKTAGKGPVGNWIIEFMQKLLKRPSLHYTLSAWWFRPQPPRCSDRTTLAPSSGEHDRRCGDVGRDAEGLEATVRFRSTDLC